MTQMNDQRDGRRHQAEQHQRVEKGHETLCKKDKAIQNFEIPDGLLRKLGAAVPFGQAVTQGKIVDRSARL